MKSLLCIILFYSLNACTQSDTTVNCFPVKHLDFFGLDDLKPEKWSADEIKKLKKHIIETNAKISKPDNGFTVPMIVKQIEQNHTISTKADETYLTELTELYCLFRMLNFETIKNNSINEKINFVVNDFYELISKDENLSHLIFTMDDGPFYGLEHKKQLDKTKGIEIQTDFGKIILINEKEASFLISINKSDEILWQKQITRGDKTSQLSLELTENPLSKNSLAHVLSFMANGEGLTLYLGNDGRFLFYFHSW